MKKTPSMVPPEQLKPMLHCKIEQMSLHQLTLLNRLLLQIEAEELADRLGQEFDNDRERGHLARVPELVRQFRAEHPYS